GLSRAFAAEREQGVIDGLVLAPSDRSAIWLGKALSILVFLGLAEIVALPAFALFFGEVDGSLVAGVALADLGIAAVGTLLAAIALGLMTAAIALIAYVAPEDADQGLSQKIFYFHVPIALTAYVMFGWGAWKALLHLRRREQGADLESYVAIHHGVIFGVLTLVTGSLWAKLSWGVWWAWCSNQLVLLLVLVRLRSAYC